MFNRLSLTRRLWITVCVYWVVFAFAMITGITGLMQARDSLHTVHANRMNSAELLNVMKANFYDSRLNVLLTFQHDPRGPLISLHDHPVSLHLGAISRNLDSNRVVGAQLTELALCDRDRSCLDKVFSAQAAWREQLMKATKALEAGDFSPAVMNAFLVAGRTEGEAVLNAINEAVDFQSEQADVETNRAEERYHNALIYFALIVLFGALPVTWFIVLTMRRMSNGFAEANEMAQAIAKGDLSRTIRLDGNDEITAMLTQVRQMQINLRELIFQITRSAGTIATISNRVAEGSELLSSHTDQQAASLEETSAATEELNSTVHQNAANAREAEDMADQADAVARRGGEAVNNVVNTMNEISDSSQKISDIVGIIDSIAFQTNILALNAAVEAARAGEQGRGFAVVASEVRALAQRSASAARDVRNLIDSSVGVVSNGSNQVSQAGATMNEIVTNNERIMVLIREIAAASQEQSIGLSEINQAMALMDDMTHQNVTLVSETSTASNELRAQADRLVHYVSAFNLGDTVDVQATTVDEAEGHRGGNTPMLQGRR